MTVAAWILAAAGAAAAGAPVSPAPSSRHVEIDGRGEVMTSPRRGVSRGRKVLEFEIEVRSYLLAPEQPRGADLKTAVDLSGPVRVVHDVGCGGEIPLAVGDRVEFRAEYVEVSGGEDVLRFTHAPGAEGCGSKDHPAGFLREVVPPTPTVPATPPSPSGFVPDQPYRGTPVPSAKSYLEILDLKRAGAPDEELLETIRIGKKAYSMTLGEIQELKDAGVSSSVIEAMLRSGRPIPTPGRTPTPGS